MSGSSIRIPKSEIRDKLSGSSSVGRASAFQAEGREFESRRPLQILSGLVLDCLFGKFGEISINPQANCLRSTAPA